MKSIPVILTALLAFSLSSCFLENSGYGIRGEGPVVERTVTLDPVKGITLPGSTKVFLSQGPTQQVRLVGQENVIENINLEVHGEVWQIGNKRPVWQSEPVKIYLTIETLRVIRISGSGSVQTDTRFTNLNNLELKISGSGKMDLDIEAEDIDASISGSGDLYLLGTASSLDFTISGSGGISASELKAKRASTRISGSGNIEVAVEDRLDARISGSGSIFYHGNPKVDSSVSGSGHVRSR